MNIVHHKMSNLNKLLENKQAIHIVTEIVVLISVVYYFNSKLRRVVSYCETLASQMEQQEARIRKLHDMNKEITLILNEQNSRLVSLEKEKKKKNLKIEKIEEVEESEEEPKVVPKKTVKIVDFDEILPPKPQQTPQQTPQKVEIEEDDEDSDDDADTVTESDMDVIKEELNALKTV